ncbi:MAG: hypothetical protein U9N53_10335, partial [Bacteroidota bacterium]|nr:hypothetical protein [Bacteroidota bacterium]
EMKKVISLMLGMVMLVCFIPVANATEDPTPVNPVGETNLITHYNYSKGIMVSIFDAVNDYLMIYNGGVLEKVVFAENESIVVEEYHYDNGGLVYSEVVGGDGEIGVKTYYEGSQSKPLYSINSEGLVTAEWSYNADGSMAEKKVFGLINEERQCLSTVHYKNGLVDKITGLKDPTGVAVDWNEEVTLAEYTYVGRSLTKVEETVYSLEYEKDAEGNLIGDDDGNPIPTGGLEKHTQTSYYEGGRIDRVVKGGEVIRKYNYAGTKLDSIDTLSEGNIVSKTTVDAHRRSVQEVAYDYDDNGKLIGTKIVTDWEYNDTGAATTMTYDVPENYDTEGLPDGAVYNAAENTVTVTVAAGGCKNKRSHQFSSEGEYTIDNVTYYHNGRMTDTVREDYRPPEVPVDPSITGILGTVIDLDYAEEILGYKITADNFEDALDDLIDWVNSLGENGYSGDITKTPEALNKLFKADIAVSLGSYAEKDIHQSKILKVLKSEMIVRLESLQAITEEFEDAIEGVEDPEELEAAKNIALEDIDDEGLNSDWVKIYASPVVEGTLKEIVEIDGMMYAVVDAEQIAIHNGEGFYDCEGETFYIQINTDLASELEGETGQVIAFNGDVTLDVNGYLAMSINADYDGGVILGEEAIAKQHEEIEAGECEWYNKASAQLEADVYGPAQEQGINFTSDWKVGWGLIQNYVISEMERLGL